MRSALESMSLSNNRTQIHYWIFRWQSTNRYIFSDDRVQFNLNNFKWQDTILTKSPKMSEHNSFAGSWFLSLRWRAPALLGCSMALRRWRRWPLRLEGGGAGGAGGAVGHPARNRGEAVEGGGALGGRGGAVGRMRARFPWRQAAGVSDLGETKRRLHQRVTERNGGGMRKKRHRWGEGGRLSENVPQICLVPSDGDLVVSVGVSKICTRILISIEYGAIL